jgi:tetratricopeptide (TPR) repeat protein
LAHPLSRGGDHPLEPPPRGRLRPGARALSKLSSKAERRAARAAGRPARCVWYSQLHTADLQHWFEQSTRQGLFHDDTPLIDAEQYASFVGRLKARLMTDEMQYGSANLRVQHGAQLLVMMCNICALRELAANRHVPALQLLKQAQQISDGVAGYTFPARRRCHAWTLDSLAYYYVRRGKFSGALSYLRKAYAITNPSEVHDVNLGTTSPRRSQRDVNLGASFRSAATLAEKGLTPSPMRGVDVLLHTRCSVVRWCLVCLCTLFLHAAY